MIIITYLFSITFYQTLFIFETSVTITNVSFINNTAWFLEFIFIHLKISNPDLAGVRYNDDYNRRLGRRTMFTLRPAAADVYADRAVGSHADGGLRCPAPLHGHRRSGHPSPVHNRINSGVRIRASVRSTIRSYVNFDHQFYEEEAAVTFDVPLLLLLLPYSHRRSVPRIHLRDDLGEHCVHYFWISVFRWFFLFLQFI